MSKFRIAYIASLIILGVLLALTVFRPMTSADKVNVVLQEHFLETEDGWIVELLIINEEGEEAEFNVNVNIDGKLFTEKILIQDGGAFTYIYNIYRNEIAESEVTFWIYKEGHSDPIEQITYHLK